MLRQLIGLGLVIGAMLLSTAAPSSAQQAAKLSLSVHAEMRDFQDIHGTQRTCTWHVVVDNRADHRLRSLWIRAAVPGNVFMFAKEEYRRAGSRWYAINGYIVFDEIGAGQTGAVDLILRQRSANPFAPRPVACDALGPVKMSITKCQMQAMPEDRCRPLVVIHPS